MTTAPGGSFSSTAPRLAAVLDLLGYTEDERLTVCHQTAGGADFTGCNVPAGEAEDEARRWADSCDVWFSVNPVTTPPGYRGRGTAAHVTRWAGVYADLDVKPGGLPSLAAAWAVIDAVSKLLGQGPVAVIHSGHGFQPLWALDPEDEATDLAGNPARLPEARALMRRFGRLVAHVAASLVAEEHRGAVDTVFDLARVLRVPGTVNRKPNPETGEPAEAPTSVELPGGSPLSVQEIADQLDAYGVRDLAGDRDGLGEIVSDPSGWGWAAVDCAYAVKTISAWAGAEPRRGRHPWLVNCATRLAAMHRWGCLTGPLHRRAVETLTRRMAELCEQGIGGHVRSLAVGEIADALTWGQAKVASKADEALPAELGAADGRHRRHQQAEPDGSNGPAGVMTAGDCAGGAAAGETDPPRPPGEGSPVAVPAELAPRGGHTLAEADAAAEVVRERLRGQYVWSKGLGWLRWDAVRWEECSTEGVRREVSVYFRRRIGESDSPSLIKLLTRKALDGVTSLAGGLLEVEAERFDADPDVINCPNGVVDLRTGRLFPHDPERYLRKLTPVEYHPSAINHPDLPRVLECLADDEVREWMQLRLGQAVTGHVPPDDILPILFGGGNNGKSTLITGVMVAAGEYAVIVDDKVLLAESGSHSTERMELFGARIGITEEVPGGRELDMNKIKKIVGTTKIQARRMRMDPVTWDATHALFITTNSTPIVKSTDHGAWRRLALVPFPIRYVAEDRPLERNERRGDLTLRPRVRHDPEVHQAVLAWLVAGAGGWYASGRVMPPLPGAVREATDRWRRSSDMILQLLADGVIGFRRGGVVLSMDLYGAYQSWAVEAGQHSWSQNTFMRALVEHPEAETHRVTTERTGKWELSNLTRPGRLRDVFYAKKKQDSILRGVYFPNPNKLEQDEVINKQHALVYPE